MNLCLILAMAISCHSTVMGGQNLTGRVFEENKVVDIKSMKLRAFSSGGLIDFVDNNNVCLFRISIRPPTIITNKVIIKEVAYYLETNYSGLKIDDSTILDLMKIKILEEKKIKHVDCDESGDLVDLMTREKVDIKSTNTDYRLVYFYMDKQKTFKFRPPNDLRLQYVIIPLDRKSQEKPDRPNEVSP